MSVCSSFQWASVVPWILVVVGWFFVDQQNNSRERRKEVRGKVDALRELIDEVEELAFLHHGTGQESLRCVKIRRSIKKINNDIAILEKFGLTGILGDTTLLDIRQSITLKNFDTSKFIVLNTTDPIFSEIGVSLDQLRDSLEHSYAAKYG